MKIAIFTDFYFPQVNGVVTSTYILYSELSKLGHDVYIMGPKVRGYSDTDSKIWRFRSLTFPFQKEYKIIFPFSRKIKRFKQLKFDLIHIQTPFPVGYLGSYLGWKSDIPVVHTYHTFWAEYLHYFPFLPNKIADKFDDLVFTRRFCNRAHWVISPTQQMKDELKQVGVKRNITPIPTGIDLSEAHATTPKQLFRNKYNIDLNSKVLIFVGRCGLEKNIYFLMDSFKIILDHKPETVLLFVGDGPERQKLEQYCKKIGVYDNVRFTGYLTRKGVYNAYNASDIITFPSISETQGLSLIEGMAMEKPAVGVDALGVAFILQNNYGGFLTQNIVDEYSSKVLLLLEDSKIYNIKAKEAKLRSKDFSAITMVNDTLNVYKKAIKLKSKLDFLKNKNKS